MNFTPNVPEQDRENRPFSPSHKQSSFRQVRTAMDCFGAFRVIAERNRKLAQAENLVPFESVITKRVTAYRKGPSSGARGTCAISLFVTPVRQKTNSHLEGRRLITWVGQGAKSSGQGPTVRVKAG